MSWCERLQCFHNVVYTISICAGIWLSMIMSHWIIMVALNHHLVFLCKLSTESELGETGINRLILPDVKKKQKTTWNVPPNF